MTLSEHHFSLDHTRLLDELAATDKLLIIQDLDGVCMGLVRDPLTRTIDRRYVEAVRKLDSHFYVLTNGEHIGNRGVNAIVERAFDSAQQVKLDGCYLPGLAGGGVQLQDRHGAVSHPGVTKVELGFLENVPEMARQFLRETLASSPHDLEAAEIHAFVQSAVLDNLVSPTINLNHLHLRLRDQPGCYAELQRSVRQFLDSLLRRAAEENLDDAFSCIARRTWATPPTGSNA